jgi:hypothetical protein
MKSGSGFGDPGVADGRSIAAALAARRDDASALVREHIDWALAQRAPAVLPG